MNIWYPLLAVLVASLTCAYFRVGLRIWTITGFAALLAIGMLAGSHWLAIALTAIAFGLVAVSAQRRRFPPPEDHRTVARGVSEDHAAIVRHRARRAGSRHGRFRGRAVQRQTDWSVLLKQPKPELSVEEQAFLDGPVEELCRMVDEWQITHELADLTPEIWDFVKKKKFFGMIIPKEYGGLEFSALAQSAVLQKLMSISGSLSSTVGVPNSLGPGELLLHYGSKEQRDYYLPRLADGREIPCFALTGPFAGSDATSIPDYGIVCRAIGKAASARRAPDLRQALHHARAGRDTDRPGLPHARPGTPARRRRTCRHHAGADSARDQGPGNRSPPFSAECRIPERTAARQGHFHPAVATDRRRGNGRSGLAHAGRMPVGRTRDHPAVECERRRENGRDRNRRLRAHAQAVRHGDRPLRGRRGSARAHRRSHLRDHGAVESDRRRGRSRREARRTVGDRQIPLRPNSAAKWRKT